MSVQRFTSPQLDRYMDKHLSLQLNGQRKISGVLRGYDQFMNLTLEDAVEEVGTSNQRKSIGIVVVRGNSIHMMEPLEPVDSTRKGGDRPKRQRR